MLLESHRIVFIHIPKNAGSSVEAAFGRKWSPSKPRPNPEWPEIFDRHSKVSNYTKGLADFASYHVLSIVRNPWDRLVSCYSYERKLAARGVNLQNTNRRLLADGATMAEYLTHGDPQSIFLRSQLSWISDKKGRRLAATVLRFENLAADFARFAGEHALPVTQLPHVNKTPHGHYSECYDPQLKELVARRYAEDIAAFGYSFQTS